ncbi:hypothetical protein [Haloferula sargassicola]|uniref:Uncharacterized protein n=1 Tax=Haloferula sargassicola TaxID=490096 RepID=A0ABP9UMT5_9BACT
MNAILFRGFAITACLITGIALFPRTSRAAEWESSTLDTGPNEGEVVAVASDRAGRRHVAFSSDDGGTFNLEYAVRDNPLAGVATRLTLFSTSVAASEVKHLAIDVGSDFTVVVAVVTSGGSLLVYEKTGASFVQTLSRSSAALADLDGGVSVVASGNEVSYHSIAYTASDGSAKFIEKTLAGWSSAQSVTSGADSGLGARLSTTYGGVLAPTITPRVVVSYNAAADRVQASFFSLGSSTWLAPETIESVADFTRPDVDCFYGKIGVSYVRSVPSGDTTVQEVRYAESPGGGPWTLQTVASGSSELADLEYYAFRTGMRFDAGGHPMVAYKHDIFAILVFGTIDVRVRRYLPGVGWELSTLLGTSGSYSPSFDFDGDRQGDPVLALPSDPGSADSTLRLFQMAIAPFSCEVPPALLNGFSHTFSPGLARGPDGTMYLVAGVATQAGVFDPYVYGFPRLFAFKGNQVTTTTLTSSSNPHVSNAVCVGNDGTVHVLSLRVVDTSSTQGDLIYYRVRNGVVVASNLVNNGGNQVGISGRQPSRIGVDDAGNVYVTYHAPSGDVGMLARLPADVDPASPLPWVNLVSLGGVTTGLDLAVRGDGGYAASYFETTTRAVRVYSNVDPATGAITSTPTSGSYKALSPGDADPLNVSCAFGPSGKPYAAAVIGGAVFLCDRASGSAHSANLDTGYTDGRADLLYRNGVFEVCLQSTVDGGRLDWIRYQVLPSTITLDVGTIATPAVGLSGIGGDFEAALDGNGLPWMAYGFVSGGFPLLLFFHDVLLCRASDSLDLDNDGIPLLSEYAHMGADNFADAGYPPYFDPVSEFEPGFSFRHPDVPLSSVIPFAAQQFGVFRYALKNSEDLDVFTQPSAAQGGPGVQILSSPGSGIGLRRLWFAYNSSFVASHPRHFIRMEVSRER